MYEACFESNTIENLSTHLIFACSNTAKIKSEENHSTPEPPKNPNPWANRSTPGPALRKSPGSLKISQKKEKRRERVTRARKVFRNLRSKSLFFRLRIRRRSLESVFRWAGRLWRQAGRRTPRAPYTIPDAPQELKSGPTSASGYSITLAPMPARNTSQRKMRPQRLRILTGYAKFTGMKSNAAKVNLRDWWRGGGRSAWVKAGVSMPQGRSARSQRPSRSHIHTQPVIFPLKIST